MRPHIRAPFPPAEGRSRRSEPDRTDYFGVSILVVKDSRVLLIRRARPPFEGEWSFPGGRIEEHETPRRAAARELEEETGLKAGDMLFVEPVEFEVNGRSIRLALFRVLEWAGRQQAGDDAADLGWFTVPEALRQTLPPSVRQIIGRSDFPAIARR